MGLSSGIAERASPLTEAEVCGDDDAGLLVKPREQVEQQRYARGGQRQVAVIRSLAKITAEYSTTVTGPLCPRALARSTQKPFTASCNVTRSTRPASTSCDQLDDRRY